MRNISRFIEEKLGLKVNMTKSKVDKPSGLKYLGFGFYFDSRAHQFKAKPHAKSVLKFKKRMKEITCRSWGVSNRYKVEKLNQLIRGWINYFKIGTMRSICYEISFFFYMKVPEDFEPECNSFTEDDHEEFLRWIAPDDPVKFYPEFFRKELLHPVNEVKHFLTDER